MYPRCIGNRPPSNRILSYIALTPDANRYFPVCHANPPQQRSFSLNRPPTIILDEHENTIYKNNLTGRENDPTKPPSTPRSLIEEHTIDYRAEPVDDYIARLTGGTGFDVVYDATGGSDIAASFQAARLNGQVVAIVSQYDANLAPMHLKGLSLHVVFMLIPMLHDVGRAEHGRILREAAVLADAGKLRPHLDPRRFDLASVADAHRHLEDGQAIGKVVIDVADRLG